jgi:predicted DNA-binding protein (UPF0251 family)
VLDLKTVRLEGDELEAARLCDLEKLDQKTAWERMRISGRAVQRLLKTGRANLLRALAESRALVIVKVDDHASLHSDPG